jgi:hypothetical protein
VEAKARSAAWSATVAAALMIAAQVGSKATRDALFLDVFSAAELPKAMLASAVLSPFAVLAMAQGLAKLSPVRLVPMLYVVSAAGFGGEYALTATHPQVAVAIIYLHVAVLGALLVSGFWSVVTERFDPHTAKKVIGRITAGATSGGLIGGLVAERVAAWLDARDMLLVLAGMSVLCGGTIWRVGRGRHDTSADTSVLTGLRYLRDAPYLKLLGLLVVLTALTSGIVDYAFKAEAAAEFSKRESLMTVFAVFYTATGLITFVAQTTLSRRLLMRLGIGGTIALLPGAVMLGSILGAAVTRLWSVIVVRASEEVISNSLYRSGYELLFTPLSAERKRPTKTVVDVGFKRVGDAMGSGLVMAVVFFVPELATWLVLVTAAFASAASLYVALRLHRGYVDELASSLLDGRIELEESEVFDATTRRTLADTTMAINREQLLAQIEELRASQDSGDETGSGTSSVSVRPEPRPPPSVDPSLLDAAAALSSGDNHRVRQALRGALEPPLVGFALPLLGDDVYGRAARRALRQAAPRALGTLVDALLDEDQPEAVRRRLPDVIASVPSRRAALGLFEGVACGPRPVRDRCVRALTELMERQPELAPRSEHVYEAAVEELSSLEPSLSRVFALLGLVLDAEPLRISLSGLRSDDPQLRGTSYEYLENVIPEHVRKKLWPQLEAYASGEAPVSRRTGARRSAEEVAEVLKQSMPKIEIDSALLRDPTRLDEPSSLDD